MASSSDLNIVVGQGTAIKEVHNIRKQHLELNQHFVAQKAEDKKKENKSKIQKFDKGSSVEIKTDEDGKRRSGSDDKKKAPKRRSKDPSEKNEGNLIDIRV